MHQSESLAANLPLAKAHVFRPAPEHGASGPGSDQEPVKGSRVVPLVGVILPSRLARNDFYAKLRKSRVFILKYTCNFTLKKRSVQTALHPDWYERTQTVSSQCVLSWLAMFRCPKRGDPPKKRKGTLLASQMPY